MNQQDQRCIFPFLVVILIVTRYLILMHHAALVQKMLGGDRLALSRLISLVESREEGLLQVMLKVQEHCGHTFCLGVTGPPGAGKSTLVNRVISVLRQKGKSVGVVAIDPSSPFSGGAVLGDRIRMQDHVGDEGVFIRSLGSRGNSGGLSRATREVVKLYDAYGMDYVIVETVGVGQTELGIMSVADMTLVLLTPESGDTIQTMKAGILEIADLFVVNKADREGAHKMQAELKAMLELNGSPKKWTVPVLLTQAMKNEGVEELVSKILEYRNSFSQQSGKEEKQGFLRQEVREVVIEEISREVDHLLEKEGLIDNPYKTSRLILKKYGIA